MKTEIIAGVEYSHPVVTVLQSSGLGVPEMAARTCYDSFGASENDSIKHFDAVQEVNPGQFNSIEHSDLLDTLAWTHFHHSILEHTTISFLIKGTSRGVLQEFARHRIQAISVRSTRYTMSSVLNAFVASLTLVDPHASKAWFIDTIREMEMLVLVTPDMVYEECSSIFNRLYIQREALGKEEFVKLAIAKSSLQILTVDTAPEVIFTALQAGKKKRNVGDDFKHLVTDNWKVDLVSTMNLRALKNFFELRDSGAAYFQAQWLAKAMKEVTEPKYLDLIVRSK
jgi:thymidylate synthase (FAD)